MEIYSNGGMKKEKLTESSYFSVEKNEGKIKN